MFFMCTLRSISAANKQNTSRFNVLETRRNDLKCVLLLLLYHWRYYYHYYSDFLLLSYGRARKITLIYNIIIISILGKNGTVGPVNP